MSAPVLTEPWIAEPAVDGWQTFGVRWMFNSLGTSVWTWWKSDTLNTERAGHHGEGRWEVAEVDDANLVSSRLAGREGWHSPILDIDFPARLVPSATEGHYHLYLDRPMKWERYKALLEALAAAKIISRHYLKHSLLREATMARPPWVEKVVPAGGFDSDGGEADA